MTCNSGEENDIMMHIFFYWRFMGTNGHTGIYHQHHTIWDFNGKDITYDTLVYS